MTPDRRAARTALVIAAAAVLATGLAWIAFPHEEVRSRPVVGNGLSRTGNLLRALTDAAATKGDPTTSAVWPDKAPTCYRCNAAWGVAAAYLARVSAGSQDLLRAQSTFDQVIARHQTVSGAFDGDATASGQPDEINTMFVSTELGTALLLLGDRLPAATAVRWKAALRRAVAYLRSPDQTKYYVNGNIQLGRALAFAVTWKATGQSNYRTDYQRELAFAQQPDLPRWAGWGLITTKVSTGSDGQGGAAYFSEAPGSRIPGFDADYTMLQSDQLSRLYLVTEDPAVLKLVTMTAGRLLPLVDRTSLHLDISYGSRHPGPDQWRYYFAAAPALLEKAGRPGFSDLVSIQPQLETQYFSAAGTLDQPGNNYTIGNALVTVACLEAGIDLSTV